MIAIRWFRSILPVALVCAGTARAQQQLPYDEASQRALRHATAEWQDVAAHLPDPQTATPADLTQAADILRARRMPDDALEYYEYALKRGGDEFSLVNRVGVTLLELHRFAEARVAFRHAVQLQPKTARAWNNLGAAEYAAGKFRDALDDYRRAVKLDKKMAVFHSNLGTVYFEMKDYDEAREQFEKAVKLDPNVFHGSGFTGIDAHVLSTSDHGRFCFEMAKMSARMHDDPDTMRWLARASESGFDIRAEMAGDKDFEAYQKDPRVAVVIRNALAMRNGQIVDAEGATAADSNP